MFARDQISAEQLRIERRRLVTVKALHTAAWLFFAGCIVLIPVAAFLRKFIWAEVMAGCVFVECAIVALNRGRCPLTDAAARYTDERSANFDIYLPEWLARHNKLFFGALFAADLVLLVWLFAD